jgi:hypothetical protein
MILAAPSDYADYLAFASQNLMLGRACRYVRSVVGYRPEFLREIKTEFTIRIPSESAARVLDEHLLLE